MPSCDLSDVNSSLGSALTPGSRDDTDMEDGEQEAHDRTCPRQTPETQASARLADIVCSYVPLLIHYFFRKRCP